MSAYVFYIKQNDRRPKLTAKLKNADGSVVDLTTAQAVKFTMSKQGSVTPKINAQTMNITNAANGVVEYSWQATETNTVDTYRGEIEVTWTADITQTFPEDDYIKIVVGDDL